MSGYKNQYAKSNSVSSNKIRNWNNLGNITWQRKKHKSRKRYMAPPHGNYRTCWEKGKNAGWRRNAHVHRSEKLAELSSKKTMSLKSVDWLRLWFSFFLKTRRPEFRSTYPHVNVGWLWAIQGPVEKKLGGTLENNVCISANLTMNLFSFFFPHR